MIRTTKLPTPCMNCYVRVAEVIATHGGDEFGCAALCGECAIEDKATRVIIGTRLPVYSRFVQPTARPLFEDAAQAMRRWIAADRAIFAVFARTDALIGRLNAPPWPDHATAA
jgi:hypothetical protein